MIKAISSKIIFIVLLGIWLVAPTTASASHITWVPTNGPKGGYSRYIVQDAGDLNTLYVGFGPSQIWKSTDGGETWRQKNNGLPKIDFFGGVAADGIYALAISEKDPRILYAGTTIGKIYKTKNGAESWQKVFDATNKIGVIKVSPHDENLVLAGTFDGRLFISRDGGKSWQTQNAGLEIRGTISGDIAFDPQNENVIYLAPSYFDLEEEGKGSGFFKSQDQGRTWRKIGEGLETEIINKIAIHPKNPNNIFLAAGSAFEWGYGTHGIYESVDGGETFKKVGKDFISFQSAMPFIAFSRDGEKLIVGGLVGGEDFFISRDNGKTWKTKTGLWGDFITDIAQFDDPDRFLATLYWSSLFLTMDGGSTWRDVTDFKEANLHSVYSPPFLKNRVYATAHSNGIFYSDDRGETWTRVKRGDSGTIYEAILHNHESSASRFSPDLLWLRGEYSSEAVILKNTDVPLWRTIEVPGDMAAVFAHPNEGGKAFVGSDEGLFMADYNNLRLSKILDGINVAVISGNENIVAVGAGDGVYAAKDQGKTFIKSGLGKKKITAVGVGDNEIYAAAENDGVYLDSGNSFKKMNSLTSVSQILIDPADENNVYFAKSSKFGVSEIYFSGDKGKNLVLENRGLRHSPTPDPQKLAFSGDGTYLYLATNGMGVWRAKIRDNPINILEAAKTEEKKSGTRNISETAKDGLFNIGNNEGQAEEGSGTDQDKEGLEPTSETSAPQTPVTTLKETAAKIFKKVFWPVFIVIFLIITFFIGKKILIHTSTQS